MKIVSKETLEGKLMQCPRGEVEFRSIISTSELLFRFAIITPNADVLPRPHKHEKREVLYLIEGSATTTNGEITRDIGVGDVAVFEPSEEHYIETGPKGATFLELKWG